MRKSTKSERYKYVRYDPDGTTGIARSNKRTKRKMELLEMKPWVAVPRYFREFEGTRNMTGSSKRFATEREAALFVDKWFLSHGREPVNILVRKP